MFVVNGMLIAFCIAVILCLFEILFQMRFQKGSLIPRFPDLSWMYITIYAIFTFTLMTVVMVPIEYHEQRTRERVALESDQCKQLGGEVIKVPKTPEIVCGKPGFFINHKKAQ